MDKRIFKKFLVICILFASNPLSLYSKIIHIPADSTTIQGGINSAEEGDTVLVKEGTYYELIDFLGKGILVASTFVFDSDLNSVFRTIIDGDSSRTQGGGSVVTFGNGEDSTSVLCGFTIRNGIGTYVEENPYWRGFLGGGIYGLDSSPQIIHNIIRNNSVDARPIDGLIAKGGGLFFSGGSPQIKENVIMYNSANAYFYPSSYGYGGGLCLVDCNEAEVVIQENYIIFNESDFSGAGIYTEDSNVMISNNNINYNKRRSGINCDTVHYGGLIHIYENMIIGNELTGIVSSEASTSLIRNNLIAFNKKGNGIYTNTYALTTIENNTIVGNGFEDFFIVGSGIAIDAAWVDIKNNIIVSNRGYGLKYYSPSQFSYINYNDVWGNIDGQYYIIEPGENDISCNPRFINPMNGNFTLSTTSPCIDAGDPESDVPESGGDRIDIGAYEYIQLYNGFLLTSLVPTEPIKQGESTSVVFEVINPLQDIIVTDAWLEFSGPTCGVAKKFFNVSFPPETTLVNTTITIPEWTPLGKYTLKARLGIFGEEIWDSEVFDVRIIQNTKKAATLP